MAIDKVSYPFFDISSFYYQSDYKIGSVAGIVLDDYFKVLHLPKFKRFERVIGLYIKNVLI